MTACSTTTAPTTARWAAPASSCRISPCVLQFHGLKDTAVDKDGLKNTWDWIAADYTLVTIPSSGHWVQSEASELVSSTMKAWLLARAR